MREADPLVVQEVFGRLDPDAALPAMRAVFEDWRPHAVKRALGRPRRPLAHHRHQALPAPRRR